MIDPIKIGNFIKKKRKALNMTQQDLADLLSVTEKAISRWETGRGTPDISLLIPLANALKVEVSDILTGHMNNLEVNNERLIEYVEYSRERKYNLSFKVSIICYIVSILIFLVYLRLEYNPTIYVNYFYRLILVIGASFFIILANYNLSRNYFDKLYDKKKITKFSNIIVFIYYLILMFNMVVFARSYPYTTYNLIPFKTIISVLKEDSFYFKFINIVGNFTVFMPFSYFSIVLFKNINTSIKYLILIFGILLVI